ncbi:dihydroneopterin aldolase [Falsigemmobacter faecalis]|uniref:dihydroneopterin aldolase n=1 Tax=Falsigemmobacter faecalis TaxID=2488730 RepID=A0A3P3DSZ0_9RHOB|nr:dihydroneopterin aldolase [Falsigemmobacter faecalis]RRH77383.1 dihydroneopterin aldolase [Falsigemmobacter faecalis]
MSTDLPRAFGHPEARAAQSRDRISVRDLVLEADIGAFQLERGRSQRLRFNVVVEVAGAGEPKDDDVDRILSYDKITEAVTGELAARRFNLLETLADDIAARILREPQAQKVFLRIEKLDRGPGALGVEIERSADAPHAALSEDPLPHPMVVHLDEAALSAPDLSARLDRLSQQPAPVILTVGFAPGPRPEVPQAQAQRRIDLLALEQNAWRLAARDPRCMVVASRTEIDWAMRQGRMLVWAPSKLVLDTPDAPKGVVTDPLVLALWFAEKFQAVQMQVCGALPQAGSSAVPVVAAQV